jgi:hypothetical protein
MVQEDSQKKEKKQGCLKTITFTFSFIAKIG